ncbi:MAG: hypothetical protein IKG39_12860 [Lachnospiraceae bacterium]|nr:hypothetical protein [Lachnospiraceae bacterium]
MNVKEINRYVNMLVGNLSFTMDYNHFVNGSKRLLIVEGQTDKKFIEKILNEDVVCLVANKAFGNQRGFDQEEVKCKSAIMQVVYGMSKIPMLINCPKGSEKWIIFGMIDLDFDSPSSEYTSTPRLFVTDTHDLETLLLSTDKGLLQKLEECIIPLEDAKKAFYLAYQMGILRQVIHDATSEITLKPISGGGREEVDYSRFVEKYEINLKQLLEYINEKNETALSSAKLKKVLDKITSDKRMKKTINKEYKWNLSWMEFDPEKVSNFWELVNGHDILSLIRYINQDAAEKYNNKNNFFLNRDFELDLVGHYEYSKLRETKIYNDMLAENVVTLI